MTPSFVARVCAVSIVGLSVLGSGAHAQTTELKVSHFLPPNHTFQKAMAQWGEQLE